MSNEVCKAKFCKASVHEDMFMCTEHWHMLPAELRRRIYRHYRNGGKVEGQVWIDTCQQAQEVVQKKLFERCIQSHESGCRCWSLQAT